MLKNIKQQLSTISTLILGSLLFIASTTAFANDDSKVFELRTYYTHPGKLDALKTRFREHTNRIFANHGMQIVGFWAPTDTPDSENTLIYIISHASREQAKLNWQAFINDPQWQKVFADSRKDGPIVSKVDSVFMQATEFSPIK